MKRLKVLLLGESYSATHTFVRGRNYVTLPQYGHFGSQLVEMLEREDLDVTMIPTHDIPEKCPILREDFAEYDVVVLSDVGSDTMLVQPRRKDGGRYPNRLAELTEYVRAGGGLVMIGGYFGFAGIGNQARYAMTPLAEALPVEISNYDDRVECPEGVLAEADASASIFAGVQMEQCPAFGGYNKTVLKTGAKQFAAFRGDPFLAGWTFGNGRAFAFTSDCAPDWAPAEVLAWEGYPRMLANMLRWTAGEIQ